MTSDVEELEGHLRDQLAALAASGLAGDEAFLVAVKRMGSLDALSREFARAHSERLWKQLVMVSDADDESGSAVASETVVVLAVGAALAVKLPALFGVPLSPNEVVPLFYIRNASLFVFPLLTVYFLWKRGWTSRAAPGWRCPSRQGPWPRTFSGLLPTATLRGTPANRTLAGCGLCVRPRPLVRRRRPHELCPVLGRAGDLLRPHRARRVRRHSSRS